MTRIGLKRRSLWALLGGLLLLPAPGCGGNAPLQPVSGKVTYQGAPVPGGTIVFTPDANRGGHGDIAVGKILTDGTYSLNTNDTPGVAPGPYRVTVASFVASPPVAGQRFPIPHSLLPERYRDPEMSMLSCDVKVSRPNNINFDLD